MYSYAMDTESERYRDKEERREDKERRSHRSDRDREMREVRAFEEAARESRDAREAEHHLAMERERELEMRIREKEARRRAPSPPPHDIMGMGDDEPLKNGCCRPCMKAFSETKKACLCQVPVGVRKGHLPEAGCKVIIFFLHSYSSHPIFCLI